MGVGGGGASEGRDLRGGGVPGGMAWEGLFIRGRSLKKSAQLWQTLVTQYIAIE